MIASGEDAPYSLVDDLTARFAEGTAKLAQRHAAGDPSVVRAAAVDQVAADDPVDETVSESVFEAPKVVQVAEPPPTDKGQPDALSAASTSNGDDPLAPHPNVDRDCVEHALLASGDRTSDDEEALLIEKVGEDESSSTTFEGDVAGNGDDGEEGLGDDAAEAFGSLPGLPDDDYGQKFDAPAPYAPMAVGQRVYRRFRADGVCTLLAWRGGWILWCVTHWSELEDAQLRSHLYRSLSKATYEHVTSKGVETKNWNPDMRKVANVMQAMRALAHLPSGIDPPSWIADGTTETEAYQMLSCTNGLFDLRTRQRIDHTPTLFNIVSVPFAYEPEAADPAVWLAFLDSLWPNDRESIMLLQEFFGYVLSGRTDMQKMLMLIGPIRSGKGTIARVLTYLIGKENVAGPTLANLATNFGLSPLIHRPLAIIADARLGNTPSHVVVERLLSITGEDVMTIDLKYRAPWTGRLLTRFVMMSNELPRFSDSSGAIATRMLILQLTNSFLDREDLTLEQRLMTELPGILNWALSGLDRLVRNGKFTVPKSSDAATTMLMDLASPVSAFVRELCVLGPNETVSRQALYFIWKGWAEANGHQSGANITFGRSLNAAVPGLSRVDLPDGDKRVHGYRGIGLRIDRPTHDEDRPAHPAQDAETAGQERFDGTADSAQAATESSGARERREAAQDGLLDGVARNRRSATTAQDALDATQCRSGNGKASPLTPAPEGLAERDEVDTSTAATANGKAPTPVRINGRPINRSAHYKAPSKGGNGRRTR